MDELFTGTDDGRGDNQSSRPNGDDDPRWIGVARSDDLDDGLLELLRIFSRSLDTCKRVGRLVGQSAIWYVTWQVVPEVYPQ